RRDRVDTCWSPWVSPKSTGRPAASRALSLAAVRALAKKMLPQWFIQSYRRRRALRGYLRSLSEELLERQTRLDTDELEGRLPARRPGVYAGLVNGGRARPHA